jgi:hypothetical protein
MGINIYKINTYLIQAKSQSWSPYYDQQASMKVLKM